MEAYLERLFMIVGQYHKSICYVDCFAGPWQGESKDLSDTSIGISLNIMAKCKEGLRRLGKDVQFRALFVEKNKKAYGRLASFLDSCDQSVVQTHSEHGEFFDLRNKIIKWCGDGGFSFFFIDPKGWKRDVEIDTLKPLLEHYNSEFLITFMYDFLVRTHTQTSFQEDMHAIFGEVPDTYGLTPEERETFLLLKYRANLKKVQPTRGNKPRSACVKVLYPTKDRTLYHLVYLTRHPLGIVKFMEASEDLDLVQRKVRAQAKQESRVETTRQQELFGALDQVRIDEPKVDVKEVQRYWLTKLSISPKRFGITELADFLEETGWFESDFHDAFHQLQLEGKVKNLDDPVKSKRRKHFIHFTANGNSGELRILHRKDPQWSDRHPGHR